jgi:hypothetical protein
MLRIHSVDMKLVSFYRTRYSVLVALMLTTWRVHTPCLGSQLTAVACIVGHKRMS